MDELCETLDARDAARIGAGAGTSDEVTGDMAATTLPEESEEVREQHRRLLAEIRSCFRLLSIHSRLSGSESPRTRRISTQTDNCESLHLLAAERAKGSSHRVLRGLSPTDNAQNSPLYNQLIIESNLETRISDDNNNNSSSTSTIATSTVGLSPHLDRQGGGASGEEVEESTSESIYQCVVNPTSKLKTTMDLSKVDVINVVEWLYRDHPGAVWRAASRKAMEDQEDRKYLTYGEVSFVAFANLLEKYAPPLNGSSSSPNKEKEILLVDNASSSSQQEDPLPGGFTFYDLGCGAGRPVYMASLMNTNCTKSCGIEIVPNMHEMNKVLLRLYNLEVQPNLHPKKQSQKLDFLIGDFLQIDWSDADIIFTNATCFPDQVFHKFEDLAAKVLKTGAIVISVTRPFSNLESWELLESKERQMSWAPALVYVYRKQGPTHSALERLDRPSTSIVFESGVVSQQYSVTKDKALLLLAGTCDKETEPSLEPST
ncbi:unnamed protein product [Calypogeia fissa]